MKLTWTLDDDTEYTVEKKSARTWGLTETLSEVDELLTMLRGLLALATYDPEMIDEKIPDPWREFRIVYLDEAPDSSGCDDSVEFEWYCGLARCSGCEYGTNMPESYTYCPGCGGRVNRPKSSTEL